MEMEHRRAGDFGWGVVVFDGRDHCRADPLRSKIVDLAGVELELEPAGITVINAAPAGMLPWGAVA